MSEEGEALSEQLESCSQSDQLSQSSSSGVNNDSPEYYNKKVKSPNSTINRVSLTKLIEERKARRCRFYRNADQWFPGAIIAVGGERHRTLDSLYEELTRVLNHPQHLTAGARHIFTLSGQKISKLESFEEGGDYVVSSTDSIKQLDYRKAQLPQWRIHAKRNEALHVKKPQNILSPSNSCNMSNIMVNSDYSQDIKPKLITVIRNGTRPRKVVRILLNKKTARSFEQILNNITEVIQLSSGAVRKVYGFDGRQVVSLQDFFLGENIFLAYGPERSYQEDFILDSDEKKAIMPYGRTSSPRRRRMPSPQSSGRPVSPYYECITGSLPRSSRKSRYRSPYKKSKEFIGQNGHRMVPIMVYPLDLEEKYIIGHTLGDGNFAVVKHCKCRYTNEEFALKIIDKSKCIGKEHMIESEVSILRKISHPNIVSLICEFETRDSLYLVMELVRGGDLFDAIASEGNVYTEMEASLMLKDLTSALDYLHVLNIVHRDVKPENLLVGEDENGVKTLKLGDFGLATEAKDLLYTVCGTPTYVAPEILSESGYGLKVDIWAAGVITYILLCGFPPFVSANNQDEQLFEQILQGYYEFHSPYWDHISSTAKDLISNMIMVDQDSRYSTKEVLSHPWLSLDSSSHVNDLFEKIVSVTINNGDSNMNSKHLNDNHTESHTTTEVINNNE